MDSPRDIQPDVLRYHFHNCILVTKGPYRQSVSRQVWQLPVGLLAFKRGAAWK
jgi:hypothetical protein